MKESAGSYCGGCRNPGYRRRLRRMPPKTPPTPTATRGRLVPTLPLPLIPGKPPVPRGQAKQRPPLRPSSGVQGTQPPPGVQRVPLFPKALEGGLGGTTASATKGPIAAPVPAGRARKIPMPPPTLQNQNYCAIVSPGSRPPARFSALEPAAYIVDWGNP